MPRLLLIGAHLTSLGSHSVLLPGQGQVMPTPVPTPTPAPTPPGNLVSPSFAGATGASAMTLPNTGAASSVTLDGTGATVLSANDHFTMSCAKALARSTPAAWGCKLQLLIRCRSAPGRHRLSVSSRTLRSSCRWDWEPAKATHVHIGSASGKFGMPCRPQICVALAGDEITD